MAFKYRFYQLLKIAEYEENEVKARLAKKDGEIAVIRLEIQNLKDEYARALVSKDKDLLEGDMIKVRMYPAYMIRLETSEAKQNQILQELLKEREVIMAELVEKRKTRRTYDKIKERDFEEYKKEQQKKEQKKLDEFANRPKPMQAHPEEEQL